MKTKFSKEAIIGAVTIVSLVLLYLGINYLKGINIFKPTNHYVVNFHEVKNLTVSSPVYVEGFQVGLVREISYDYSTTDRIAVSISLDDKMRINKGSYITVIDNFLSGAELHIHLNKYVDSFMQSGDTIEGRLEQDMMSSVQENMLPAVEEMLPRIDSILVGLQTLINHPALAQSFDNIQATTNNLAVSTRQLNQLLGKDVPVIVGDLKNITSNISHISSRFNDLDIEGTFNNINATMAHLKLATSKMNSTDNTLGLLLNDSTLYKNLNTTTVDASTLLQDLKKNPKRYVHFSLF